MGEIKNPFSFGTGDIDKDLWLRDIDNEQEDFIARYGSAANKHRTALLRLAFQDLRARIASGDMLNRTADGLYQFGSALNRDDKHMQEAYQRALGFMGDIARRQLNTPAPEPEKKVYSPKTLEDNFKKTMHRSGNVNMELYWNNGTDADRRTRLRTFLESERDNINNYDSFESWKDKDDVLKSINIAISKLGDNSNTTDFDLGDLGFSLNWITKPTEQQSEETSKTEEELLTELEQTYIKDKLLLSKRKALDLAYDADNFKGETLSVSAFPYDFGTDYAASKSGSDFMNNTSLELFNYFKNLGTNWRSLYLSTGGANGIFRRNLSRLFSKTKENKYPYWDVINKYFTPTNDGNFLLNNTNEEHDRLVFFNPSSNGFLFNIRAKGNPYELYIPSLKEGGIIKFLYGATIEDLDRLYKKPKLSRNLSYLEPIELLKEPLSKVTHTNEGDKKVSNMDTMDWVGILTPAILDLTSMVSANVPGYGTAFSAGTGIASTLWTGTREWQNAGWESGLKTIGMGLTADALGLIPGWGSSAKLGKIAKGLSKYAKYIGPALAAKGFGDAAGVVNKMFTKGTDSLTKDDMNTLLYGLVGLTSKGTAGVKRANRSNLERAAATQYRVTSRNGNTVTLNAEQLAKLRQQHKVKKATPVVTQDALIEANDQIMLASKWPVFGSVSLNRLLKMIELRLASDRNVFKNTIWKPGKKGYTEIPAYKPYGLNSQDWGLNVKTPITKKQSLEKFKEFKDSYYKRKKATAKEQYGGVLKALRNGGIVKALAGTPKGGLLAKSLTSYKALDDNGFNTDWANLNFGTTTNQWFPGFLEARYDKRGNVLPAHSTWGFSSEIILDDGKNHFGDLNLGSVYDALQHYFDSDEGANIFGDVKNAYNNWRGKNTGDIKEFINYYNSEVDWLRSLNNRKLTSKANTNGWKEFNQRFNNLYSKYSPYDSNLEDIIGESTWLRTPNSFKDLEDRADLRHGIVGEGGNTSHIGMDNEGHLFVIDQDLDGVKETSPEKLKSAVDSTGEIKTPLTEKLKDPFDPTLLTIAGKTLLGLRGNKDIYGNLLKEMPQAPLRDPIDRKLAIVGWQEQIKQGQNQLADLRNIYSKLVGSDALVNLAGALEVEGKGRDIMNDKFMKDSERQFATAQRSWDLDNDDYLRNNEIYYLNDRALKDRARMMAQIRAAWRSGDNNILMGGFADASNWLLKRYQREQDVVDRARGIELGTPESRMQERLVTELGALANKKPSEMTAAEIAQVEAAKAKILRQSNKTYASDYYNMFHVPGFGGGYYTTKAKDGTKLEVAKLKARGKDNDRYVSMIKDLRQSSRRRRRR